MPVSFIRNRKVQTVLRFIVDFLKNNPVHCTSYLAKTCIHWSELVFWIIILLASTVVALLCGLNLVKDYNARNTAVTFNVQFLNFETLYPSVTICPEDILNKTKLDEFVRYHNDNSISESRSLRAFLQHLSKISAKNSYKLHTFKNNIPAKDYMQLIFNLSNYYNIVSNNVKAVKIMTDVGICYTINNFLSGQLHTKFWSDSYPYPEYLSNNMETKTFKFGKSFPLVESIEHNIVGNIRFYMHSPYEIPTTWTRSTLITNGVNLKFVKINTFIQEINYDKNFLRETKKSDRSCIDKTESNLKLFPSAYSRNLCLMECRRHYIQELCNCVPHFYSNKLWKDNKVCNIQGLICFSKHLDIFRNINANTRSSIFNCGHCKSNCIEQVVVFKITKEGNSPNNSSHVIQYNIDRPSSQSLVRSAMYAYLDFIVSMYGVLSTFLGFCIYSVCDLIYFFTVRLYWFRKGFRGSVDEVLF